MFDFLAIVAFSIQMMAGEMSSEGKDQIDCFGVTSSEETFEFAKPSTTGKELKTEAKVENKYESLPITIEEQQKIAQILTTMAENNVFLLLFEKKRLERLGHEINHVHPIRFLGTVFNDPSLVNCLNMIKGSGFKWGGFIDGFSERLRQEIRAGNVNIYIPGLAAKLGIRTEEIQGFINRGDIEGLVLFLLEKSRF